VELEYFLAAVSNHLNSCCRLDINLVECLPESHAAFNLAPPNETDIAESFLCVSLVLAPKRALLWKWVSSHTCNIVPVRHRCERLFREKTGVSGSNVCFRSDTRTLIMRKCEARCARPLILVEGTSTTFVSFPSRGCAIILLGSLF